MTDTTVNTVTVTCACGSQFDREVKRGRPQMWCEPCRVLPFYDRAQPARPAAVALVPDEVVEVAPVLNENDRHADLRETIEFAVAQANADYKARYAALVAGGMDKFQAADEAGIPDYVALYGACGVKVKL